VVKNYTIVVIEDNQYVSETLKKELVGKYQRIEFFDDPANALNNMHKIVPDILLMEMFCGQTNGLDVLEQVRKQGYSMPIIFITSPADLKLAVRAIRLGAEDFIIRPIDLEQLDLTLERSLRNFDLRRRVELLNEQIQKEQPSEILGRSPGLRRALELGHLVAKTDDTTALICGETGTGKELMARFIHEHSPRVHGPFVTINCGAIPRELAENEFFGYERGAFTGATEKMRPGKFEQAQHGTILLDEISELSMELQVKLLRVLQERKFYRLGGAKEISVDVRVIASTNKDLEDLVEACKFREDLFYRLNVAKIDLPPLRDRGDDILSIATSFIDEFNRKFTKNISGFTPEAATFILGYPWKGNIRELRNAIERITLLETKDVIDYEALSFLRGYLKPQVLPARHSDEFELQDGFELRLSETGARYNDVTKYLITDVLKRVHGNQIKAAKILGISRAKLRYRVEQLDIIVPHRNGD
jgi:DNA-binding NtrC family response regulator